MRLQHDKEDERMEDNLFNLVKTILNQSGSKLTEKELLIILKVEANKVIRNSSEP